MMKKFNIFHNFKTEADILKYLEDARVERELECIQHTVADVVAGWRKIQEKETCKYIYTKQHKWIGKLCKFWNGADNIGDVYTTGTLIEVETAPIAFRCDNGRFYRYCEPLTADDELIYKGERNA